MSYVPNQWRNFLSGGTPISADRLNRLEQGLSGAAFVADIGNPATATGNAVQVAFGAASAQLISPGGPTRRWAPQATLPAVAFAQEGDEVYVYTTAVSYFFKNGAWRPVGTIYNPTPPTTTTLALTNSTPTYTAATTPFASVQVNWTMTKGTDALNPTGVRLGRDGTDVKGVTATTNDQAVTSGAFTWSSLTPGATYHFTAQLLTGTTLVGSQQTVTVVMPTAPPVVTPTTLALTATPGDGSVTVVNKVTPGNDGIDYSGGILLSRNGTDANGAGPYSTTVPANSSFVFGFLSNGTTYTFSGDMKNAAGTARGNPVAVSATPQSAGNGPTGASSVVDTDAAFTYTGTWQTDTVTAGASEHYSNATGASAAITVTIGTAGGTVSLTGATAPAQGKVSITVDGGTATVIDLYSATEIDAVKYFTSATLTAGSHKVVASWTGTKNVSSTGTFISIMGASTTNGGFAGVSGGGPNPGGTTSAKFASLTLPSRGWFSGSAGAGTDGGATDFGTWRGDPTDADTTWQDAPDGGGWSYISTSVGPSFTGWGDYRPGGPSNMGSAAGGSLDGGFSDWLGRLRSYRTVGGVVRPTSISPCHEMNGTWYAWSVNSGNLSAFLATMRRWRNIQQQVFPEAFWVCCFNWNTLSDVTPAQIWGSDNSLWDVVGSDWYNNGGFNSNWSSNILNGTADSPEGIERWRQFAQARGVPLCLPEYGQNPDGGGDNPYYVNNLYPYIRANKGKASGQIVMDAWFNLGPFSIYPSTSMPSVAAAYQAQRP